MLSTISAKEFRALFQNDDEFAVIDARETNLFYQGHLLSASNIPLGRLEVDALHLIPGRNTHIVLCDWETAKDCHDILHKIGYKRISVIDGGISGWHLAGGRIFQGWNAIGKAFGSYIYQTRKTPTIDAPTLKKLIESDTPPLIIDTRTPSEYEEYCIPGSISCPNGETLYRVPAMIDDPDRLIVMHCAGHTRGIMGAQTLIDAGIKNRIVSLNLGTLEWAIDGMDLEWGANRRVPIPESSADGEKAIATFAKGRIVSRIDTDTLTRWETERDSHTLIVFDVRSHEEFEAGTWHGARFVVPSQLMQSADQHLVSRNVRTVLLDTDGIRSTTVAVWLTQMGYKNIHVCTASPDELTEVSEPSAQYYSSSSELEALAKMVAAGKCTVVDTRGGVPFRHERIKDSWLLGRSNPTQDIARLPAGTQIALVGKDPKYAELVKRDLGEYGREATIHINSLTDWMVAGFELDHGGVGNLASEPHDAVYDLEELEIHVRDSHEYILWRENLYYVIGDDPAAPYMNG